MRQEGTNQSAHSVPISGPPAGLPRALAAIADVLACGREKHPDDDGFQQPASYHVDRARKHLEALERGDRSEPHLEHAAARLLMALEAKLKTCQQEEVMN